MPAFRKSGKYSHKEKSELIITKKKIEYEGELSNYYNEKLKRHMKDTVGMIHS